MNIPQIYEGLYRVMLIYDKAPDIASRLFGEVKKSPVDVDRRFIRLSAGKKGDKLREIGCAFNYAKVSALFNSGNEAQAQELLEFLVERDQPISVLNTMLETIIGSSYVNECMAQRQLLTPQELDRIIFERYAPESANMYKVYREKEGVAVVMQNSGGRYAGVLFYTTFVSREAVHMVTGSSAGETLVRIMSMQLSPCDSFEELETEIRDSFRKLDIDDYRVIKANDAKLLPYIAARIQFYNSGKVINLHTPIRQDLNSKIKRLKGKPDDKSGE